jgi:V/A-type H+-transporting ATPase subunit D
MVGEGRNATRMELLRLRRRLGLARRGHRLLKGKQDELLRRFLLLLEEYLRARSGLHERMEDLAEKGREVRTSVSADTIRTASWPPPPGARLRERKSRVLNLKIPAYDVSLPELSPAYGPGQLPACHDELVVSWRSAIPVMVEVAEKEKALLLLAAEIERTRRRVNALEYNLIPGLEEGVRTITFKLAEAELGNLTRLMRIKDIVRNS